MTPQASPTSAGIRLGRREFEREANAYLQARLFILLGVATAAAGVIYLAYPLVQWATGQFWLERLGEAPALIHLGAWVSAGAMLLVLRRGPLSGRTLRIVDALSLQVPIATCVAIYGLRYRTANMRMLGPVAAVFVIARAVIVPSTARKTFLLSLTAPLGFFAVQLWHGWALGADGLRQHGVGFWGSVHWDQTVQLLALGVATVASYVTFTLRSQIHETRRMGQYQLEEKIGDGAMGEVYRATHAMLRRPTAIKLLRPQLAGQEAIERFEREVRQTSRLTHPNTVSVFDYGRTADGIFYYAMEYLQGADLKSLVQQTGPMPPARVIHVLSQVCGALMEAHRLGIVHRDIKAANIYLCEQGGECDVSKLLDFGLVKDLAASDPSLTSAGAICGTPETIAPEVFAGETAGAHSDLYSLGTVGYYLLTGERIFDATNPAEFMQMHLTAAPVPPTQRDASIPKDIEAAILHCLEKDPAARPRDASAWREELSRCADRDKWTNRQAAAWWEAFAGRP